VQSRTVSRWLVSVAVLASAVPASAQIALAPPPHIQTLDVSLIRGSIVATGRVVDFQQVPGKTDNWRATVLVSETLRGRPNATLTVEVGRLRSRGDVPVRTETIIDAWLRSWALLLIAVPADSAAAPVIIDLSDPELAVMTADLELLRTPDAVVDAAKDIIRRTPAVATPATFSVAVEVTKVAGTPVDTRVRYSSPADFLFADVPVDARLERRAREALGAAERQRRLNAIEALGLFKSASNIALLRELLDDEDWRDTYSFWGRDRTMRRIQYNDIRRQAYTTLRRMGVDVREPDTKRPPDPDSEVVAVALDDGVVTSGDVRTLTRYPNLEHLYLSAQTLSEDDWAVVFGLRSLRALFLEGSNISDAGLARLSTMPSLGYLGLGNTRITDAGLMALAAVPSLKKIDLGQGVTEAGVAALRQRRPDIEAREDEFAFLASLRPRRIERPFVQARNYLLPVEATAAAAGVRAYTLIFPKETAGQVESALARELPPRGWSPTPRTASVYRYRREGAPVPLSTGAQVVDQVIINGLGGGDVTLAPGERAIVVAWNVDPTR
jgi:hypothetical protein